VRTGERQCPLCEGERLLQASGLHQRLSQGETTECLTTDHFRDNRPFHRLREQRYGIGDAPDQGIRRTQGRSHPREKDQEACVLTEAHRPFEPRERARQIALAEGQ